jgi:hypothetical protein
MSYLRVPALAVVTVPNQISTVRAEHTWHATRATSRSVSKAITEDSVGSGHGGVLVAHFVVCVVVFVCCYRLRVLDLIWINIDRVCYIYATPAEEACSSVSMKLFS